MAAPRCGRGLTVESPPNPGTTRLPVARRAFPFARVREHTHRIFAQCDQDVRETARLFCLQRRSGGFLANRTSALRATAG